MVRFYFSLMNLADGDFLLSYSQSLTDLARGCGLIERVEVNASDLVVQKVGALLSSIMEADLANGLSARLTTRLNPQRVWLRRIRESHAAIGTGDDGRSF